MTYIEKYRADYRETLGKFLSFNLETSIWSVACSNHVYACSWSFYDTSLQRVPALSVKTVKQAVEQFVLKETRVVSYD